MREKRASGSSPVEGNIYICNKIGLRKDSGQRHTHIRLSRTFCWDVSVSLGVADRRAVVAGREERDKGKMGKYVMILPKKSF